MTQMDFAAAMTQRGCVGNGNEFCGSFNGYPFSSEYRAGQPGKNTTFFLKLSFGANINRGQVLRKLKKETKGLVKLSLWNSNNSNFELWLQARVEDASFDAGFDTLLRLAVEAAQAEGVGVSDVCPLCKQQHCDSFAYMNGFYKPVHDACVRNTAVNTQAKFEKNQRSGNYLLGILGAILGAIVGVLPSVLLAVFLDVISAWACALIPIFAYQGYKLLGGKRNKISILVVVIVSVLVAPLLDFAILWAYFASEVGFYLSDFSWLFQTYYEMLVVEADPDLILSLGQNVLFIALGVFISWGIIKRDGSVEVRDAAFSATTLRPMNAPVIQPGVPAQPNMADAQ